MFNNSTSLPEIYSSPYAILQASVHGFIVIFGASANVIVLLTYLRWRRNMLNTPRDLLILSLALADCITSLFVAPFAMASSIAGKWLFSRPGCIWYGFISTWMGLVAILQLTGIAAERYYTLAHLDLRWSHFCKKYTRSFIACAWLISGIVSSFPLVGWSKYEFEGTGHHCSIVWTVSTPNYASYCLCLLVFFFTIPLGLIIYYYTNVYFVVRRLSSEAASMWGVGDVATKQSYTAQVKVAKQLLILTGMFLLAWTPYAVLSFLSATKIIKPDKLTSDLPALFAKMSHIYNPLVYFFTFKRLRMRSVQLFKSSAV